MNLISVTDIKHKISSVGLKATSQRIAIYQAVMKLKNHPTVEMILEEISPLHPSISVGTLYKNLETLVEVSLLEKVKSEEGNYRFEANLDKHNHIYCSNTKEIIDYQDDELDLILFEYFKKKKLKNLKINDIRLQISAERLNINKEISIQ
ncbi:MAG: transcriptional repressor [Cytophagales bacterium]|nr:MAG: transcriptional repressor [Cytophagales bacterium]